MKHFLTVLFIIVYFTIQQTCAENAKPNIPFFDHRLSTEERIDDLESRLTPSEKGHMITLWNKGVPRLGLKSFMPGEALHGLASPKHNPATVFPQSIGLAASWDPTMMKQIGDIVSDEARAQYHNGPRIEKGNERGKRGPLHFWSPVVNIARDPRWGRNQESYGEDPFLISQMATNYVKGLQGDHPKYIKAAAGAKHFVANNEEHNRFKGQANISEKQLREYYFPAYKAVVQDADAKIVMTAYNALNGTPCVMNKWLVKDVLRDEWGFDGMVLGDYGSVAMLNKGWGERGFTGHERFETLSDAAAAVMNAETLDFDNTQAFRVDLIQAIDEGKADIKHLNRAFRNTMRLGLQLGMFDPEELSPWKDLPFEIMCSPKHKEMARIAAEKSFVLLQNNEVEGKKILPIETKNVKKVALIGPNATALNYGTYSGVPTKPVSLLDGLRAYLGDDVELMFVPWATDNSKLTSIPMENITLLDNQGLGVWRAKYYNNMNCQGKPIAQDNVSEIQFDWGASKPNKSLKGRVYSVSYTTTIVPTVDGLYDIGVSSVGGEVTLQINGQPVIRSHGVAEQNTRQSFEFKEGETYHISLIYMKKNVSTDANLSFGWQLPQEQSSYKGQERKVVAEADVVIAAMGLSVDYERESIDRPFEGLPQRQIDLLKEVLAVNPNVAVVLQNGSSIESPWLKANVPAILETWYPGEQGGVAIVRTLFGEVNPGGKLPMTFVKTWDDLPAQGDYDISKGRSYMYFQKEPLFAFGHGLSYTSFELSGLSVAEIKLQKNDTIHLEVNVKNTGKRIGDEVVQVYVKDLFERTEKPIQRLKAFQRVRVNKGENKVVSLEIPVSSLAYWDEVKKEWTIQSGAYELRVGNASDAIVLTERIEVK